MKLFFSLKKNLIYSFIATVFFYSLFIALRALFVVYIGIYQSAIKETNLAEYCLTFVNGFRYDGQIIGVLSTIFFFLTFLKSLKILKIYTFLVITITTFVGIANIGFYEIYGDVFNAILLGLVFDDQIAIFQTALKGDFNLFFKFILWFIMSFVFYFLLFYCLKVANGYFKNTFLHLVYFKNSILFLIFIFCILFAINGHIGLKGISLGKEIKPVQDVFLRKISVGSFRDLFYVYKSYTRILNSKLSDYTDENIFGVVANYFDLEQKNIDAFDLTKLLQKEVKNESKIQIQHIFYIIAESFSQWHLDSQFDEMELSSELKKLINSDNAFASPIFLENASKTIDSLDVQISGLFMIDIPLNLSVGKNPVFKMAPGYIFKELGYKMNFYYGGSGTWQKLDTYTLSQGFDSIFYNAHVIQNAQKNGSKPPFENSWGVFDHYLYDFIKINTDPTQKTFSMIMTTSNHPPYDTPVEQFNPPLEKIEKFLNTHPQIKDKELTRKVFLHIWYQDKMIANFIKETSKSLPNSLFVITGDHYDRYYPFKTNLQIIKSVPFILYAPSLKPKVRSNVGSHIDITPTIVELVAPKGYKYLSFGSAMLDNSETKIQPNNAFGLGIVANDRFFYDGEDFLYHGERQKNDEVLARNLFERLKRARALSWWIFKNGYEIKE